MATKKAQIKALYDEGKNHKEVAVETGFRVAYVRWCFKQFDQQKKDGEESQDATAED